MTDEARRPGEQDPDGVVLRPDAVVLGDDSLVEGAGAPSGRFTHELVGDQPDGLGGVLRAGTRVRLVDQAGERCRVVDSGGREVEVARAGLRLLPEA